MSFEDLVTLLAGRRVAVLTGAGISTDSGIPDYRSPDSPPRNPITYQEFKGDPDFRQRYWARNHVGWRFMDRAQPNAGHRAVAALEARGVVNGVITQNVDRLHQAAGSRNVIDLHGHFEQVICLDCGETVPRAQLHERLVSLNPDVALGLEVPEIAPDADAVVEDFATFVVANCEDCDGIIKPDIVYFGENVPKPRVERAYAMVDDAQALLVVGSSLTVMSGLRFVRHAAKTGKPVAILNRGATRGDPLADVKLELSISDVLPALVEAFVGRDAYDSYPAAVT
ncbi:MAG: NAD-dependent deacetylase [Nocardioidaceae bacterium]|nr:NAD-dependent deacetylase [Nocardioidaceae bacterium]